VTVTVNDVLGQLVRYLIVGGCGYVLAVACYAGALAIGVPPYPAVVIVFALNGVFNFTLFRRWAFPRSGNRVGTEARRFAVVALVTLAANYAVFGALYSLAGLPPLAAQALAIVAVTPIGFVANRSWSFGRAASAGDGRPARVDDALDGGVVELGVDRQR
jgi:putative flippase GtrA